MERLVRIDDHTLNEGEKKHLANREVTVRQCLLKHKISIPESCPNIALIGSGGGQRAMVALLGCVLQLGKEDLLDCMMYLSGVSGSTWCMASLYKETNWSSLESIDNVIDGITKRLRDVNEVTLWTTGTEKVKKYFCNTGKFSLTHLWSAIAVPYWVKEIDEHVLSDHREKHDKDPYPIYTVIDKKIKQNLTGLGRKDPWVEMTPHEAGYSLTGAFVDQKYFGSQFDNGKLIKEHPEMDMLYVQGLCGSAPADGQDILIFLWTKIKEFWRGLNNECSCQPCEVLQTLVEMHIRASKDDDYSDLAKKINKLLEGKVDGEKREVYLDPDSMEMEKAVAMEELKLYTLIVCECFSDWYKDQECPVNGDIWLMARIIIQLLDRASNWIWGTTYNFLYNMTDSHGVIMESQTNDYEDAGLLLNSPYLSVLRPERKIDLIISLDFSDDDPMETVEKAHKMSKELDVAFPHVEIPEDARSRPQDFYVFPGEEGKTPTVIHMPLFNIVNCGAGLKEWIEKYKTFQLPTLYSPEMISDLMGKAAENVANNKDRLLEEIKKVIIGLGHSVAVQAP